MKFLLSRISFLAGLLTLLILPVKLPAAAKPAPSRPNVLWLSTEDIGPHIGAYGDSLANTPELDGLAARGVRFTNAFSVAGVCAPNRSAIITGVYPVTLGTHHMRSGGEGTERSIKPHLPNNMRCFSAYLREMGYYCTNNSKEDYNFPTPPDSWDESSAQAHWQNRPQPDQPFFAVFNNTNTHEGSVRSSGSSFALITQAVAANARQDPALNIPPPYHPDTPVVRNNWAKYRELITAMDHWVGEHLEAIEHAGLTDDTIVFFWSDHGPGLPRAKRWLYDSGTHIPLIVYIPEKFRDALGFSPGTVDDRLVSSLDFAPTVLRLCGLSIPSYMQGRSFLHSQVNEPRAFVYGARDRMDERYDIIRMVRNERFKYIRNYEPFKPYDQFMNSAEKSPVKQELHRLAAADKLEAGQGWVVRITKPVEELYDCLEDPHELHNLADDPKYRLVLETLRRAHEEWMVQVRDLGLIPESELVRLEERFGSRYQAAAGLVRRDPLYFQRLRLVASMAGRPRPDQALDLASALEEEDPSFRFWGARGLGLLKSPSASTMQRLGQALNDPSACVRVAAASSLLRVGASESAALGVLREELKNGREWVRLHAVIVLDRIGEKARPAVPELKAALNDPHNKYVVRVANRALNQLLNTDNQVP